MINLKLHFLNYVNRRNIDIKETTADQGFLCFCDFYKVFSSITQFRDMMIYGSDLQVSPQEFVDQKCHEIDVEKIVLSCARRVYLDDQENSLTELNLTYSFHPNSLKSIMKFQSGWCTHSAAINEFFINQIGADSNFKALKSASPVSVQLVPYDVSTSSQNTT